MTGRAESEGNHSQWRYALVLALVLRVIYSLVAVVFGLTRSPNLELMHTNALTANLPPPNHNFQYLLVGIWQRFDTLWYLHIAAKGYQDPASVVFFPLYAALIRALSFIISPPAAALLISTAAAFFLFWGLQELWQETYGEKFARQSVLVCGLWPASFVLFAGYAESLVFALIVWSLVQSRRERWILAAALGLVAALAKAVGVVVIVPLLILGIRQRKTAAWAVLLIPLGPACFWEYLHRAGDVLFRVAYGEYWGTVISPPWATLWHAVERLSHAPEWLHILDLGLLLLVVFLSVISRERIEYRFYAAAAILIFLCKDTTFPLHSMTRYVLIVFPAYAGFVSLLQRPWLRKRFAMVCAVLFSLNVALLWLFLGWSLVV